MNPQLQMTIPNTPSFPASLEQPSDPLIIPSLENFPLPQFSPITPFDTRARRHRPISPHLLSIPRRNQAPHLNSLSLNKQVNFAVFDFEDINRRREQAKKLEAYQTQGRTAVQSMNTCQAIQKAFELRTADHSRRKRGPWTQKEDDMLRVVSLEYNGIDWKVISWHFNASMGYLRENMTRTRRSLVQCMNRWNNVLNPDLKKGRWNKEEDARVREHVRRNGAKNWGRLEGVIRGRIGKQCRDRWVNHLRPGIKKGEWTEQEEQLLLNIVTEVGTKWKQIGERLGGRTENDTKNRFHILRRRKEKEQLLRGT